jgi:hypothetical protein
MLHQIFPTQRLEEIVFTPITKNIITRYMNGMMSVLWTLPEIVEIFDMAGSTASATYNNLAISTRGEAEKALTRRDSSESDLQASLHRALSYSTPPPAFYRNYCPGGHSDSIFGAPLRDLKTNQDNVSKVMKICIEEVEKRGLDTKGIYSVCGQSCMYWEFMFSSTGRIFIQCTSTTGQLNSHQ